MLLLSQFIGNTLDLGRTAILGLSPFLMVVQERIVEREENMLVHACRHIPD